MTNALEKNNAGPGVFYHEWPDDGMDREIRLLFKEIKRLEMHMKVDR